MSPNDGPDVYEEPVKAPLHSHYFEPEFSQESLTSPQLRKLSRHRAGQVRRCTCGFIAVVDVLEPVVYSRNGSTIPWESYSSHKHNNRALYPSSL